MDVQVPSVLFFNPGITRILVGWGRLRGIMIGLLCDRRDTCFLSSDCGFLGPSLSCLNCFCFLLLFGGVALFFLPPARVLLVLLSFSSSLLLDCLPFCLLSFLGSLGFLIHPSLPLKLSSTRCLFLGNFFLSLLFELFLCLLFALPPFGLYLKL